MPKKSKTKRVAEQDYAAERAAVRDTLLRDLEEERRKAGESKPELLWSIEEFEEAILAEDAVAAAVGGMNFMGAKVQELLDMDRRLGQLIAPHVIRYIDMRQKQRETTNARRNARRKKRDERAKAAQDRFATLMEAGTEQAIAEVAKELRVTPRTIYRYLKRC